MVLLYSVSFLTSSPQRVFGLPVGRWVKHFDKLLNGRKDKECVPFTTTSSNQILKGKTQDTIDAPTIEEIETALKKLKNNKAPGTDNIPAELIKFGRGRLKQWLKHIFSSVWANEEIL